MHPNVLDTYGPIPFQTSFHLRKRYTDRYLGIVGRYLATFIAIKRLMCFIVTEEGAVDEGEPFFPPPAIRPNFMLQTSHCHAFQPWNRFD